MDLVNKYVRTDYTSHEDFYNHFEMNMPENFNFGYDVVDELAKTTPDAKAMIWCNDHGEEHIFTFQDMKYYSDKTANFFRSLGIKKGDFVMLILKRHYQFWFSMVALHKIGAIAIPATHLLTKKDIVYRCNAADITTIVATGDGEVPEHVDSAAPECPTLINRIFVRAAESGEMPEGWIDFTSGMEAASENFVRPTGEEATKIEDMMLMYFTSGTTGQPKMVAHNFSYPLAHIITAKFWQIRAGAKRYGENCMDSGFVKQRCLRMIIPPNSSRSTCCIRLSSTGLILSVHRLPFTVSLLKKI